MTYGLIGAKLGHSYSAIIHGMLGRYEYDLLSIDTAAMEALLKSRNFSGLNVTIPYKKAVIPFCDHITDLAREIGSVNCLYFKNGELWGTNTDYRGFLYAAETAGISFEGKKVLILGNGGTSLTVRKAVSDRGASTILITSRRNEDGCISYNDLQNYRDAEVIINTTPVGTYPDNGGSLIDLKDFPQCCGVIDVIYNPLATDLLQQAESLGIPHTNGLPMLVAQATAAAEHFLDEAGLQNENLRIIGALKKDTENIILTGMPGCGKSTLGRMLADMIGKTFVDMDAYIVEHEGASIPEIFEKHGEEYFRSLETLAAETLGKERGQIIATGGGAVLRPENMKALSQNGRIVFLKRPLEELATEGRPLSTDPETIKNMYGTRLPLYNKYSSCTIDVYGSADDTAERLKELLGY